MPKYNKNQPFRGEATMILGGRYQIIDSLGRGGFGETYLAQDTHLPDRPQRVVKRLQPQSKEPAVWQVAKRLFDQEAKVLYGLGNNDKIPQLFAHFEEDGDFYLVQEYIPGDDLSKEINGTPATEAEVTQLLKDILEVLAVVQQQNIIHRDLKPSNLMRRSSDNKIVMIDFGAIKQLTTQILNSQQQVSKTVPIGSPGYMPKEQELGHPRLASDIHAVGIIAIEALTGIAAHLLPRDGNSLEIVWRDRASVSPKLADILDKMVRYDCKRRYKNAGEVLEAIQQQKFKFNPKILIIIAVIIGLIGGIFAVIQVTQEPEYKEVPPGEDFKF
jgi:serine/threonine protein kinase